MSFKKVKRVAFFLILLGLVVWPSAGSAVDPKAILVNPNPSPGFNLELWVDRAAGATYYPGDHIEIFFRSNNNAYVYLLDIDTQGRLHWLLPSVWFPDNYLPAHQIRKLPDSSRSLTVEGPEGIEWLVLIASTQPLTLPYVNESVKSGKFAPYIEGSPDKLMSEIKVKGLVVQPSQTWATTFTSFKVTAQQPVPQYGSVSVSSNPVGATVFLDGQQRGTTPMRIDQVSIGKHEITLVKAGYYTFTNQFTIERPPITKYVSGNLKIIPRLVGSTPQPENNVVLNKTFTLNQVKDYFEEAFSFGVRSGVVEIQPSYFWWADRFTDVTATITLDTGQSAQFLGITTTSNIYVGQKFAYNLRPFRVEATIKDFELRKGFFNNIYYEFITFDVVVTWIG